MSHSTTRQIASITVPDTPTITAAISLARANLNDQAYNHIMRSWLVGQASLSNLPSTTIPAIDVEAFAVAAILHDLGWSHNPSLVSTDKRFEVDGANAARAFLEQQPQDAGWTDARIELVWHAIALHTSVDIALHAHAVTRSTSIGIMAELFGPDVVGSIVGADNLGVTTAQWEEISRAFPRDGLKQFFVDVHVGLCRTKPETTYGNYVGGFGEVYLKGEGYSEVGHRPVDMIESALKE
ncbi:hypothetical protein IQ07DRAFT_624595 [Pyrenochaeta sp. DS3sAY3a]|nr:hypothetical protein IQ07DRAFT_624595 [Pyrenochaeta sp. DS3sAY3a]